MRIGIITDFFPMYGAKTIAKLAHYLEKSGHSVVILTSTSSQTGSYYESGTEKYLDKSVLIRLNSKYFTPSGSPIALPLSLPILANRFFTLCSVDIVHIHFLASYSFQMYALLATVRKQFPLVATPHGVIAGYSSPFMKIMAHCVRAASKISLKSIDSFTVVSKLSGSFLHSLGVPLNRIKYVPNGVDTSIFFPQPKNIAEHVLGLKHSENIRVLFLAHLRESKGVDLFLDAARNIHSNHKGVEFIVVGSGPLENHVSDRCSKSNGCISHISYLDESLLSAAFNIVDVYVLPSYVEGLPQSLLEAMACGIPCIATDVGGVSELFPSDTTSFLIPPGDRQALEEAIIQLIENKQLRDKIAKLQHAHVIENYSLETTGLLQLSVYKKLIKMEENHQFPS